ncbi:hypothetical protein PBY51_020521 [Eleginops maclovinus]|uniref:ZP domain-containing protein n=1 Tax=Eleginops maclovinus TaxID=56733 RepID=A0AAN8AKR9_ELEMC|nr:hypothetical protein PBY51_020521 [Eleginops maclovinus]
MLQETYKFSHFETSLTTFSATPEFPHSLSKQVCVVLLVHNGVASGIDFGPNSTDFSRKHFSFSEKYPADLVTLPVGSPLYVGVSVEETDPSFAVVLEDCYATHSSNPHNSEQYPLIHNKCPADRRQVSVVESGSSLRARFSSLFFLLQHEYRDLYLHCSLSLCDRRSSSCVPPCTHRNYRSVSNSEHLDTLTVGPILWEKALE